MSIFAIFITIFPKSCNLRKLRFVSLIECENLFLPQQFILKRSNKFYNLFDTPPMKKTKVPPKVKKIQQPALKCHSRMTTIAEKQQRTHKNTIYKKRENTQAKTLQYVFPVSEAILLNLMRLLQQTISYIYEEYDYMAYRKKYYVVSKTGKEFKEPLYKLYNVEEYSIFQGRSCKKVTKDAELPQYVWVRNVGKQKYKQIKKDLTQFNITFSQLDGNLLIERANGKQCELQSINQKIKSEKQSQVSFVSNYLKVELEEDSFDLLNIFSKIEKLHTPKKIYRYCSPYSKMHFFLEFNNVFDMLATKLTLIEEKIPFKYVSQDIIKSEQPKYRHLAETSLSLLSDLPCIIDQLRHADILQLEMYLNSTQNQFGRHINFLLDNWDLYQPFLEDEMGMFQNILVSYTQAKDNDKKKKKVEVIKEYKIEENGQEIKNKQLPLSQIMFQYCDKRYTSAAEHSQWMVPKCRRINQCYKDSRLLIKQLSLNKNNHIFAAVVSNTINIANYRGEIRIINADNVKQSLHEYISKNPEFQSQSRRAARWEHLFSLLGIKHFLWEMEKKLEENEKAYRADQMTAIEKERLLDLSCFGCCPFFYEQQNIRDSYVNKTPLKLIESAQKIKSLKLEIKQAIRYLMNHLGGVILFDCIARHRQVLPKGIKLFSDEKLQIQNLLKSYFQEQMQSDLDKTIIKQMLISFVPVVKNPLKHKLKNGKRGYIESTFITRVKIDRKWSQQKMKSRQQDPEQAFFSPKISCFHTEPCYMPQQQIIKNEKGEKNKDKKPSKSEPLPLKQRYPFISLVICAKQNRDRLNKYLKSQNFGEIQATYESFNFRCAINSAILFHKIPLEDIKQIYNKKQQQYAQQNMFFKKNQFDKYKSLATFADITLLIMLPDRSKAKSRLELEDFREMIDSSDPTKKQFENEQVIFWSYAWDKNKEEYYFQVKCKLKSVLLFYVLHSFSQKSKFRMPDRCDEFTRKDMEKFTVLFKTQQAIIEEKTLRQQLFQIFFNEKLKKQTSQK